MYIDKEGKKQQMLNMLCTNKKYITKSQTNIKPTYRDFKYDSDVKGIQNRNKQMFSVYKVWQNCRILGKTREINRSLAL